MDPPSEPTSVIDSMVSSCGVTCEFTDAEGIVLAGVPFRFFSPFLFALFLPDL